MKLDRFFNDLKRTIERILQAFDHNITVQDNFGPSGAPEGYTIISRGPELTPVWGPGGDIDFEPGEGGTQGPPGGAGPPGPIGPPGPPAGTEVLRCIVTSGGEVVVDNGEVVWSCDA